MPTRHVHLGDIIEVLADAVPDRVALITNQTQRTYGELDDRATRLANHLAGNGVRAGDHVAVHAMNGAEWPEAFYACFKIRAVPININYKYVENELCHLYKDSNSVAVIVAPEFLAHVEQVQDALPDLKYTLVLGEPYEKALAEASPDRNFGERSEDDHYIVYTGGTTGAPKGVVWRQGDIVYAALNAYRQGAPIDRVEQLGEEAAANQSPMRLQMMGPMMHAGSQWAMGSTHLAGGTAILYSLPGFDPHEVLDLAAKHGAVALNVIGDAMAKLLVDHLAEPGHPEYDLSKLAVFANGGAPISHSVRQRLGQVLPGVMLIDSYGSSETGTTAVEPDAEKHTAPRFRIGPETTVLSLDRQNCLPGEVGMLARSGHIPLGYYHDPAKTEEAFCTVDGTRWALSGDWATIDPDGSITVVGRGSLSINTGGEKVHPEEVEAAITAHDDVLDAAVIGTYSDIWGEQVTALVQVREGHHVDVNALKKHCKQFVAGYKVPKEFLFVDVVPRTEMGKVDYRKSKARAQDLLGLPA
ncbi:MAG: AMP-binding protein [Mycobacteriaceae bacterium]